MMPYCFSALAPLLVLQAVSVLSVFTNLPNVPVGVFNVSTRIEIRGTKDAAWEALTDFPKYPDWNPFVRAAVMVAPDNSTLRNQYPQEGKRLFFRTQIPALPLPVDRNTPDIEANTQYSYENVTHIQRKQGRMAWECSDCIDLEAERWSAVSNIGRGRVLYESREVFSGPLAGYLETQLGAALQSAFDAQGKALKVLLENCSED